MPASAQKESDNPLQLTEPSSSHQPWLRLPRADCLGGPRPCPLVGCPYNNYLEVNPRTGRIHLNRPNIEPEDMPPNESCSLDLADSGALTLEEVGQALNLTRERIRQIEIIALEKIRAALGDEWIDQLESLR